MPSHSEGPGIWLSVWRFLMTHCMYERAANVLARLRGCAGSPEPSLLTWAISTKFAWRGPFENSNSTPGCFRENFRLYHRSPYCLGTVQYMALFSLWIHSQPFRNNMITAGYKGHLCLRRVFSLITKIWSEPFDFALSLLLTHVVCMKTYIIMFDHQWFT